MEKRNLMGRSKSHIYAQNLHQQAYNRLQRMLALGESKQNAKADGTARSKIFSANTYATYWKHIKYFIRWVEKTHPECKTLKKAKKLVPEWLQVRVDQGLSAWTIHTEEAAVNKLFSIAPDDPERFQAPKRKRQNIKRSRIATVRDWHFSTTNNDELIRFCKGTGLRRSELENLKGGDVVNRTQIEQRLWQLENKERTAYEEKVYEMLCDTKVFPRELCDYVFVRKGKGGRMRLIPIIGPDLAQIVKRIRDTKRDEKVWLYVHLGADIHSYRADYATALYRMFARSIEEIPYDRINKSGKRYRSEVYICRKDEAGKMLDKRAMVMCSKALGHNRINVVANNYLRNL